MVLAKKMYFIGILTLTVITLSCTANEKQKDFDYGKIVNDKYINSFFGIGIKIPPDWIVQTKKQVENIKKVGGELIAGDDENMKAIIKASEINTAALLVVFKYEVGTAVTYNPNLAIVVENLINFPGIKSGKDYLFHSRKLLEQSKIKYDYIDKDFKKKAINNQDFYIMETSINFMGQSIKQEYYSTILNGFCLSVIISYVDDIQKFELEKMVNSMEFNE